MLYIIIKQAKQLHIFKHTLRQKPISVLLVSKCVLRDHVDTNKNSSVIKLQAKCYLEILGSILITKLRISLTGYEVLKL